MSDHVIETAAGRPLINWKASAGEPRTLHLISITRSGQGTHVRYRVDVNRQIIDLLPTSARLLLEKCIRGLVS